MDINILSEDALEKKKPRESLKTFYSIMRIPSMFVSILSIGYFFLKYITFSMISTIQTYLKSCS